MFHPVSIVILGATLPLPTWRDNNGLLDLFIAHLTTVDNMMSSQPYQDRIGKTNYVPMTQ